MPSQACSKKTELHKTRSCRSVKGAKASPKSAALDSTLPCKEAAAMIIHNETTPPRLWPAACHDAAHLSINLVIRDHCGV